MLSIVVPVHNSPHLESVLAAIVHSELGAIQRELIVVDDASTDACAEVAAGYADLLIRLSGQPRGPAYARNRGVEAARGDLIAFIDADIVVAADALRRMVDRISRDSTIGAVMGTYRSHPHTSGAISGYRNLLREFEQQVHVGETGIMSAGLLVVGREALSRAGLFDEWRFLRPQVEALELGDRLRAAGFRIYRESEAHAAHLKHWSLPQWIGVDLIDRGIAVARLNHAADFRARAQRVYLITTLDGVTALIAIMAFGGAVAQRDIALGAGALAACGVFAISNLELISNFTRKRGLGFAVRGLMLHVIASATQFLAMLTGRLLFHTVGEPQPDPLVQAWSEVGVRMWPPVPAQHGKVTSRFRAFASGDGLESEPAIEGAAALE